MRTHIQQSEIYVRMLLPHTAEYVEKVAQAAVYLASAYVSMRQHASAYVRLPHTAEYVEKVAQAAVYLASAYVSIRQHASAYVSIRQAAVYLASAYC